MEDQVVDQQLDDCEDEEFFFQDIDLLQNHGINVADIKKLKSAGICTLKGVQMMTRKKLGNIKGLSEAKVDKIKEVTSKIATGGFLTALAMSEKRKQIFKISTGSQELELRDYINTLPYNFQETTDTQEGKLFSLTQKTPYRLRSIADRFDLDQEAALDNVLYARAYTSEHQYEMLDYVAAKFHEEAGVFKLLIVDSIMALFRVDFCGRGELADRQQKLAQMLSRLQKISEEYNIAVFITNQMTADPGATMSFQADPKKPIGGHILAHASTTRISLRKGRGELRIAKIYDSPDMPESEATYAITCGGITDAKE